MWPTGHRLIHLFVPSCLLLPLPFWFCLRCLRNTHCISHSHRSLAKEILRSHLPRVHHSANSEALQAELMSEIKKALTPCLDRNGGFLTKEGFKQGVKTILKKALSQGLDQAGLLRQLPSMTATFISEYVVGQGQTDRKRGDTQRGR